MVHTNTRGSGADRSFVRQALNAALILLAALALFREFVFDPLPGVSGSIIAYLFFPIFLASLIWSMARMRDEVQRASAFEGYAWGALVGLGVIHAGVVIVLAFSGAADWLQTQAADMNSRGGLNPAAIGFGFGAMFSIIAVGACMSVSRALWWASKR